MAGIGQPQPGVSVPQGPLVTPATPVGQDAVNSMIDAFRKGQITSQEIVDRFGMKARAETQLGTAQAEAALPLVEPTAQLQQAKTAAELATTNWGQTSLKTAQETMGWFGDDLNNYKTPDGKTDFQKLAKVGAQRVATLGQVDRWANMLKPVSSRTITLGDGSQKVQYLNAYNQDVTPPSDGYDGSEQYWHYVTQLDSFMPKSHPLAGIYPMKYDASLKPWDPKNSSASPAGHPTGTAVPRNLDVLQEQGPFVRPAITMPDGTPAGSATQFSKPEILAENPRISQMRAALIGSGKSQAEVMAMTPQQVAAATPVQDLVTAVAGSDTPAPTVSAATPATPAAAPVILPKVSGVTVKYPEETVWTSEKLRNEENKIRDNFVKEPPVQNWLASVPYQKTFEKNADRVRGLTPAQQKGQNLNAVDMGIAESLIKLYDPQGVIREFKWDKMTSHQPTLDVLKSGPELYIKRNGTFTPETRKELIRMGDEIIAGREEAAAPYIAKTVKQAQSVPGVLLDNVLTSEDERILAAKTQKSKTAEAASATGYSNSPGPGWELKVISNLGPIWRKTGSNLFVPAKK